MKYCPNPECQHLLRTGSAPEYIDTIQKCANCATELLDGEAPVQEEEKEEELPPDTLGDVEKEDEEPIPLPAGEPAATLDPPPAWDSLETKEPEVSDAEKKEFDW